MVIWRYYSCVRCCGRINTSSGGATQNFNSVQKIVEHAVTIKMRTEQRDAAVPRPPHIPQCIICLFFSFGFVCLVSFAHLLLNSNYIFLLCRAQIAMYHTQTAHGSFCLFRTYFLDIIYRSVNSTQKKFTDIFNMCARTIY